MSSTKHRRPSRRPSRRLTEADAVTILKRLALGEFQNRIAADYDVNPGRISEIKTGQAFGWLRTAG